MAAVDTVSIQQLNEAPEVTLIAAPLPSPHSHAPATHTFFRHFVVDQYMPKRSTKKGVALPVPFLRHISSVDYVESISPLRHVYPEQESRPRFHPRRANLRPKLGNCAPFFGPTPPLVASRRAPELIKRAYELPVLREDSGMNIVLPELQSSERLHSMVGFPADWIFQASYVLPSWANRPPSTPLQQAAASLKLAQARLALLRAIDPMLAIQVEEFHRQRDSRHFFYERFDQRKVDFPVACSMGTQHPTKTSSSRKRPRDEENFSSLTYTVSEDQPIPPKRTRKDSGLLTHQTASPAIKTPTRGYRDHPYLSDFLTDEQISALSWGKSMSAAVYRPPSLRQKTLDLQYKRSWLSNRNSDLRQHAEHLTARRDHRLFISRAVKATEPVSQHRPLHGVSCTQVPSSSRRYLGQLYDLSMDSEASVLANLNHAPCVAQLVKKLSMAATRAALVKFNYIAESAKTLIKEEEDRRERAHQHSMDMRDCRVIECEVDPEWWGEGEDLDEKGP